MNLIDGAFGSLLSMADKSRDAWKQVPQIPYLKRIGPFPMVKIIPGQYFLVTFDPKRVVG